VDDDPSVLRAGDGLDGPPWFVALFLISWLLAATIVTRRSVEKWRDRGRS